MGQTAINKPESKTLIHGKLNRKEIREILINDARWEEVETEETVDPTIKKKELLADLRKYLSSSTFKDVGPITARRIVSFFGIRTTQVIESSLHELLKVKGVGRMRMLAVKRGWVFQNLLVERSAELTEPESD